MNYRYLLDEIKARTREIRRFRIDALIKELVVEGCLQELDGNSRLAAGEQVQRDIFQNIRYDKKVYVLPFSFTSQLCSLQKDLLKT